MVGSRWGSNHVALDRRDDRAGQQRDDRRFQVGGQPQLFGVGKQLRGVHVAGTSQRRLRRLALSATTSPVHLGRTDDRTPDSPLRGGVSVRLSGDGSG